MSQVMIASLMVQLKQLEKDGLDIKPNEGMIRHLILNTIRSLKTRFSREFGEVIIACDNKVFWRKEYFPYYKANRKKNREESTLDWNEIFTILNKVRDEIRDNLPYRVINTEGAEADDVIAVLAKNATEKVLIISGDKDYTQLQKYEHVSQYDSIRDRYIITDDPHAFLKEHIIRGDTGDGIPNFLSPDDIFLQEGVRQKSIFDKKVQVWLNQDPQEFCDSQTFVNYKRNETLIDFDKIPEEIQSKILDEFDAQAGKNNNKIFNYFVDKGLRNLMDNVNDFYVL
jgi:hypothetical protein